MNFLAHIYLSGDNIQLAFGNLIADGVKGKAFLDYPKSIQKGIILHREIDNYTDHHPLFKACVSKLFPTYHHYSRVIIDMYFDHFLAANWEKYHRHNLESFSLNFFNKLQKSIHLFPEHIQRFCNALIKYNWFQQYTTIADLKVILYQMEQRTAFTSNLAASTVELSQNYDYFEKQFSEFIKEIKIFTQSKINTQ